MPERIPQNPDDAPSPPPPRALQIVTIGLLTVWAGLTLGARAWVEPVARAVTAVEHALGLDVAPGGST